MAEGQKPEKKISTVENVLVSMVLVFANTTVAIMNLTIILAPFTPLVNLPVFAGMQFYLRMKGIKPNKMLVGGLIEFVPIINIFPVDIITWIVTVITENNPAILKAVDTAKKVTSTASQVKERFKKPTPA